MIVSPAISQRNYIINNDTTVGYTKLENRKIAIIFLKGDSCKSVSNEKDKIISNYKNQVSDYMTLYLALQDKNFLIQADRDNINTKLNISLSDNKSLTRKRDTWRFATIIATVALVIKMM